MKRYVFILSVLALLTGCANERKELPPNTITIEDVAESVDFDDVVEDYQYIELSQDKGFVLGDVRQIIFDNDLIYVSSDGVFCYDMTGKPVFKISSKGRAKSEFIECTSISVDGGVIFLYDKNTRVLHKYNSLDGSFVENVDVPVSCRELYRIPGVFVMDVLFGCGFHDGKERFLTSVDLSRPSGAYLGEERYRTPYMHQVAMCDKSVIFADYQGCSFFRFDKDGCDRYDIHCKETAGVPEEWLGKDDMGGLRADDKNVPGLTHVYENDRHITGSFSGGNDFCFVYNKSTRKSIAFKDINTCDYRLGLVKPDGVYKDYFVYIITSDDYDFFREAYGFGEQLPATHPDYGKQKVLLEHDPNGNPIVALIKYQDS